MSAPDGPVAVGSPGGGATGDSSAGARPAADGPFAGAVPGSAVLAAVAVMDRLRSPGGCPWDAAQTHVSLLRYLVEECYELVQAIEDGDPAAIREELGDVLLQVLFHARIAAEQPRGETAPGFDIDDVAGDLVNKLVRRHPHVFAEGGGGTDGPEADSRAAVDTPEDQQVRWDELKKAERGRSRALDGVALGQPAAALAGKLGSRAAKNGLDVPPPGGESVGEQLFRLAYAAGAAGIEPEVALRDVARAHAARLTSAEDERARAGR